MKVETFDAVQIKEWQHRPKRRQQDSIFDLKIKYYISRWEPGFGTPNGGLFCCELTLTHDVSQDGALKRRASVLSGAHLCNEILAVSYYPYIC